MSDRGIRKAEATLAFDRLPLNSLRVFEAVAAKLSFAEAAEALYVTPAAVSMQIKSLEDYVQVPLFRRSGRRVELTPEGAQLLPGVRRGLADLQQSVQQLRRARATGALSVTTITSFLLKWLLPRLPQFHERFPNTDLRIHTSRTPVDFRQTDFHAALRMVKEPDSTDGLYYEKLLDEWFVPVCSPQIFAQYGQLTPESDLKELPLLHSSDEPWRYWSRPAGARDWKEGGSLYDDSLTVLAAAEQGQGYALTRWALAARDLQLGRLVRASSIATPCPRSYFFVCPESYVAMPKVKNLLEWLRDVAKEFVGPDAKLQRDEAVKTEARPERRTRPKKSSAVRAG